MQDGNYLDWVQIRMPNSQSSFDVSGYGTSGNERTGWSYIYNAAYNCTHSYGTWYSSVSVCSFWVNVYDR